MAKTAMRSAFWKSNPRLGRLRLRHLDALLVLAKSTSFHDAAQTMGITQPTISALVRDVEEAFGVQLYERSHSGIRPTEFSAIVTDRVQRLLAEAENLAAELHTLSATGFRTIRVGALAHVMLSLAPRLVGEEAFKLANLALEMHEGSIENLFEQLSDRTLDCVIGTLPSVIPEGLVSGPFISEKLYEYETLIIGHRDHPLWVSGANDMAELARHRWALPSRDSAVRRNIDRAFEEAGVDPPQPAVVLPSIAYGIRFAAEAEMLVCISWPTWESPIDDHLLRSAKFPVRMDNYDISLSWRSENESPAVAKLLRVLRGLDWLQEARPPDIPTQ